MLRELGPAIWVEERPQAFYGLEVGTRMTVMRLDDGSLLLLEHHCPVCEAASVCQGLCRSELELFQAALGDDVEVERVQHLLSGDQRCAYRIRAAR